MYDTPFSTTTQLENPKRISIYRADGKAVIGEVVGEVFYKPVKGSRHMLHTPRAWALDCVSLEQVKKVAATDIEIEDEESKAIYRSTVANFEKHGFVFDRGFGRQIGLALSRWTKVKQEERPIKQLPLFGGAA